MCAHACVRACVRMCVLDVDMHDACMYVYMEARESTLVRA